MNSSEFGAPEDAWVVRNELLDRARLDQFSSVCTVTNGYLAVKGRVAEDRGGPCGMTLVNGVYDELDMFGQIRPSARERPWLDPRHFDAAGHSPGVANLPDPLAIRIFVEDRELTLERAKVRRFLQGLDLRSGVYHYRIEFAEPAELLVESWRFASLGAPHRIYMRHRITPGRDMARLRCWSGISGDVHSHSTRERQFDVVDVRCTDAELCRMSVLTRTRRHLVDLMVSHRLVGHEGRAGLCGRCGADEVFTEYDLSTRAGRAITLERMIIISTSEDGRHGERLPADPGFNRGAGAAPTLPGAGDFDHALAAQREAWEQLWQTADVQIEGDDLAQRYLRFCIHHLLAAAPRFTDRLSVPVKLLSGDHYQGNTFYDTDLMILPFYNFVAPEYARTCLNWRVEGLREGRRIARRLGADGAKLAWQGGPYGEECLGDWYWFTRTNVHINADAAYALRQYVLATGDQQFLEERGRALLAESARFYTAQADADPTGHAFHLHNVAGPDEAHCHSTDNFYTNYFVRWLLRWTADLLERSPAAAGALAAAHSPEPGVKALRRWREIAEKLRLLHDPESLVYEQYDGFHQLPPPPEDLLAQRRDWFVPLAWYQALNQPDVLMAMALFREDFTPDVLRANWAHYAPRSMNFSSMSFGINAIVAAELGDAEEAYRNFMISAGMDLDQALTERNDAYAGLHGTAMGGAWMAVVFGLAGVLLTEHSLRIKPCLPAHWTGLKFNLLLRGTRVEIAVMPSDIRVAAEQGGALDAPLVVGDREFRLRSGEVVEADLR